MERKRKQIPYQRTNSWDEEKFFWAVLRWSPVHTRTCESAKQGHNPTYATREECQANCDALIANNSPEIVAQYFPDGTRPAQFWVKEDDTRHIVEACEPVITHVHIKSFPKAGRFDWWIYEVRCHEKVWLPGSETLEETKKEVLEIFPDAVLTVE